MASPPPLAAEVGCGHSCMFRSSPKCSLAGSHSQEGGTAVKWARGDLRRRCAGNKPSSRAAEVAGDESHCSTPEKENKFCP